MKNTVKAYILNYELFQKSGTWKDEVEEKLHSHLLIFVLFDFPNMCCFGEKCK